MPIILTENRYLGTCLKKSKITRRQIIAQLILLTIIGLSVCLFLSLFTYNPSDPGWSRTAWHTPISNFGGYLGAYVSDVLFQFLGFVAFSIPVIFIFFCLQLMHYFYRHANDPINYFSVSFRIIGILAFIFSSTGFFALNIQDAEQFEAGGYLGSIVIESLLPVMSNLVTSLVLLATSFACVTLLTGLSWLYLIEKLGALVMLLLSPIRWLFSLRKTRHVADDENDAPENPQSAEQEQDPQFTIPFDHDAVNIQQTAPLNIKVDDKQTEAAIKIDKQPQTEATLSPKTEDDKLKQTTMELVKALQELNARSLAAAEDSSNKTQNQLESDDILTRIESILQNMKERDSDSVKSLVEQIQLNKSATVDPFEHDKYTISDAPSKPLFIMNDNQPSITLQHDSEIDEENEQSAFDPIVELSADEPEPLFITPQIMTDVELPERIPATDVDIDLLKKENPVIEDIYPVETTDEKVQTFEPIADDEQDSLIHPLLRRDDTPRAKPTTPLPSLNLLTAPPTTRIEVDHAALNAMAELIEKSLADYRVKAKVVDYMPGPVITRFEIELAPGIKAARISTLDRDLARSLSMPSVRVVEVIPGKPYVGIELPNKNRQTVYFREVLDSPQFKNAQSPLTVVLGKDIAGQSVVADLAKMPHLLVAGTTGSGKSVGVNAMILSILYKSQPEDVRFIMIDPKMLELSIYEGIPHLLTQVVTDMKDAANALNWCVNEMERRYRLMSFLGVRNIAGYNEKIKLAEEMGRPIPDPLWKPTDSMDLNMPTLEKLPYIVVMVDEFADLIMAVGKKVEELIARLAQKARAAGIHLVLATQRPSVDVITGLIKANIPTRIAFTVSSKIDSRTILDQMGAESLLGMGDMLYLAPNSSIPIRVHGAFVRDEEVHAVVQDWKARGTPKYIENVTVSTDDSESGSLDGIDEELDPLFDQVVAFVVETRRASISSVQRKFRIGYNRAARIVEQMELEGIISPPSHNGNREVLATQSQHDF